MKDKKIKYTDMCIYIDNNINKPNADIEKIYDYLVKLSYMLAVKRKFFNKAQYYKDFSYYFATIIYNRLTDSRQFLDKNDPNYITPIVSCLNYMKQIIYARKCAFAFEEFNHTTANNSEESDGVKKFLYESVLDNSNSSNLFVDIVNYFNTIERTVKEIVYNGIYGLDKSLAYNIYTSLMLSLLRNFTLSEKNKRRLIDFRRTYKYNKVHYKINYENIITDIMIEETLNAPEVFHLDNKYKDYIAVLLQKVKMTIIEDIKYLSLDYSITDDMIEDILMMNAFSDEEDD